VNETKHYVVRVQKGK